MGRKETDEMSAAQIFYPCMQAADVFFLKADICQLGMDQRKVNMLARYAPRTRFWGYSANAHSTSPATCSLASYLSCRCREYAGTKKMRFKPVIISHHMLMGLKEGQEKMSKSDPDSAIFMEDAAEDVKRKVRVRATHSI